MSHAITPPIIWQPSPEFVAQSHLQHYQNWLAEHYGLRFADYEALWQWSVDELEQFWESLWRYFDIQAHSPYTQVLDRRDMPGAQWFAGSTLNYAEHVFRRANAAHPAIIFKREGSPIAYTSWAELSAQVASCRHFLQQQGIGQGDRVAAFLPNVPQATVAFLAAASLGAVWSSCSPDFGTGSVVDRFAQIEPKVLIATTGYQYGGKHFDRRAEVQAIAAGLPSVQALVWLDDTLPQGEALPALPMPAFRWADTQAWPDAPLRFDAVPFGHPIWVLYSSGTTGMPKAITHSQGGVLLEHLKYLAFHNDCHAGERFFWYTTTGWMMWNFVNAALLAGASIVLYDGSPAYPNLSAMWQFVEEAGIQHFGTSAPFLVGCMRVGLRPKTAHDLSSLRSIGSTGSPLPPEAFDWVYENVGGHIWLCSMSGGTDVCSAFVGGCPSKPLWQGEIQCRALGCHLLAYDDAGQPLSEAVGEMVITKPMPSMPIYFWGDADGSRYAESYFEMFPGIWRHGDWIRLSARGTLVILGRSDATLNRQGIRIGSSEIYRAVDTVDSVADSLIVSLELAGGKHYMPLFVCMKPGHALDEAVKKAIKTALRETYSPRHVPDDIIAVAEIPYTISGKKMERPVKRILMGERPEKAAKLDAMRNPAALDAFVAFAAEVPRRAR